MRRTLHALVLLVGCTPTDPDTRQGDDAFADGPTLTRPGPHIGGVRVLTLSLIAPGTVQARVKGSPAVWTSPEDTDHSLVLAGLPVDELLQVEITAEVAGIRSQRTLEIDTLDEWPSPRPRFEVLAHDPDRVEPGFTLLTTARPDTGVGVAWVLDPDLRPVWWLANPFTFGDARISPRGTLLLTTWDALEVDWDGTLLRRWATRNPSPDDIPLPIGAVHHELYPLDGDRFLTLGLAPATAPSYPRDLDQLDDLAEDVPIVDTPVVEFSGEGEILRSVALADVLDTARVGFFSLDRVARGGFDWVHGNGVIEDPRDGRWIVSSRHQSAVFKLDPDTGELLWILGDPAGWSDDFAPLLLQADRDDLWPYAQHAPELQKDGTLVLFDNGNHGGTPYTAPRRPEGSRVVAYEIDEEARTVRERWSMSHGLFSSALGDADVQPQTGNVLAVYGFLRGDEDGLNADHGRGRRSTRIIESHPDAPDERFLDLRIWGPKAKAPLGWSVYRAERLPTFPPAP